MARQPRFRIPGIAQHVVQRGNNRQPCFFSEHDYRVYLGFLSDALEHEGCTLHAFVLMTNHVHLLVTPSHADGIPSLMQSLGRRYVQHVNDRNRRTGTLWEGRYKSTVVDNDEYLLTVYRYIELNPVRAAMVARPDDHPWSSFRDNVTGDPRFPITAHETYTALARTARSRSVAYRGLFEDALTAKDLEEIRECTQRGWPLGGDRFQRQIAAQTGRRLERNGWGGARRGKSASSSRDPTP